MHVEAMLWKSRHCKYGAHCQYLGSAVASQFWRQERGIPQVPGPTCDPPWLSRTFVAALAAAPGWHKALHVSVLKLSGLD